MKSAKSFLSIVTTGFSELDAAEITCLAILLALFAIMSYFLYFRNRLRSPEASNNRKIIVCMCLAALAGCIAIPVFCPGIAPVVFYFSLMFPLGFAIAWIVFLVRKKHIKSSHEE